MRSSFWDRISKDGLRVLFKIKILVGSTATIFFGLFGVFWYEIERGEYQILKCLPALENYHSVIILLVWVNVRKILK